MPNCWQKQLASGTARLSNYCPKPRRLPVIGRRLVERTEEAVPYDPKCLADEANIGALAQVEYVSVITKICSLRRCLGYAET